MCLTSSRPSSSFFWAFERRVSALTFSWVYHSSGFTFWARWASISTILVLRALDLAMAAFFCSLKRAFSLIRCSLDLMTVASLILARSEAVMMTASYWLLPSVLFLILRSSSTLMTVAPPTVFFIPLLLFPKRVSSTILFDLLLALDPTLD